MAGKKTILNRREGLYLKEAGVKGRGMFCTGAIRTGEILELSPTVILNEAATAHVDRTILANYTFETGSLPEKVRERLHIKKTKHCSTVVMGIASFCNHDENPNAEILWEEHKGALYYTLKATRPIPKNTEICTTYGANWFKDRD